jgi:arylsulfatase A-like enzyme
MRFTLLVLLVSAATALVPARASDAAKRSGPPNVVIIYTDDMGFGDLSMTGNRKIQTANIDSIASAGVRFSTAYTTAPLCSPSRAGLLAGRYQQSFGFEGQVSAGAFPDKRIIKGPDGRFVTVDVDTSDFDRRGIPVDEVTLPEMLKARGYATGVVGKWHLGHRPQFLPQNRGFDYSFVFLSNTSLQFEDLADPSVVSRKVDEHDEIPGVAWTREGLNQLRRNGEIVPVKEYLMWRLRDEALGFIERNRDRPFFLYFPLNATQPPLQVPREHYDRLSSIKDDTTRAYQAMVLAADDVVGALLRRLRELGLEEDTLVIYANDNGSAITRPGDNSPFTGGKFDVREGGIRTPLFMKWPARLPPGRVYEGLVSTLDVLPTVLEATGAELPAGKKLDGVNLLPYLEARTRGAPHDVLYWKLGNVAAVRRGPWKLNIDLKTGSHELYEIERDVKESVNLASSRPEVAASLRRDYDAWASTLPPPAWVYVPTPIKGRKD